MDMATVGAVVGVLGGLLGVWVKLNAIRRAHDESVSKTSAREALQEHRLDELEDWKRSRGDRDRDLYNKLDEISQRLASVEAILNGRDR